MPDRDRSYVCSRLCISTTGVRSVADRDLDFQIVISSDGQEGEEVRVLCALSFQITVSQETDAKRGIRSYHISCLISRVADDGELPVLVLRHESDGVDLRG